jgi:hypothetical protein
MYFKSCRLTAHVRGPFEKLVDSSYYSDSELRGGAVTVSVSKYLPWQAMHFLQRYTHFSETCCKPFATSFRKMVEQAWFYPRKVSREIISVEENLCASKFHRPDGWVVRFLIHYFQAGHRIQSRNADAPLRISSCSAVLKIVLLKRRLEGWRSRHYYVNPTTTTWHKSPPPSAQQRRIVSSLRTFQTALVSSPNLVAS